jgi:hypothetical protein
VIHVLLAAAFAWSLFQLGRRGPADMRRAEHATSR